MVPREDSHTLKLYSVRVCVFPLTKLEDTGVSDLKRQSSESTDNLNVCVAVSHTQTMH